MCPALALHDYHADRVFTTHEVGRVAGTYTLFPSVRHQTPVSTG